MTYLPLVPIGLLLAAGLLTAFGPVRRRSLSAVVMPLALGSLITASFTPSTSWWGVDRLALFLAVAALIIGGCALRYAERQFAGEKRGRSIIGASYAVIATLVATDLATCSASMLVSWVATSLSAVGLLAVGTTLRTEALLRRTVRTFLLTDGLAVLGITVAAFLVGPELLTTHFGSGVDVARGPVILIGLATALGACGRAGLTLRSSWVTQTIAAPTSVSALLHAGVVNAGALLIVRHQQLVGSSAVVQVALAVTCLVVLVRLAPRIHTRVDLKGQLATSTVSQMAFMLLAIAAGWPLLAFTHLVGHGLYKAARFMAAGGAITTRSVTRRLEQQGSSVGMGPRLLGAAGLAVLSAALGLALGQEVLAALSVIGAGAIAMWWHRTASPVPQPLVTVALLAGSLALYSLVLAALGALLNDELPLSTPTTPWFAMAFAVGVTTLGNTLSTVRRDQHVSVHRTEVTQPVLRHEVAA